MMTFFVNDCMELATLLLRIDPDSDISEIEDKLVEKYNLSFDNFMNLIEDLIPFTSTWKSILTKQEYKGFVYHMEDGIVMSIIKREC